MLDFTRVRAQFSRAAFDRQLVPRPGPSGRRPVTLQVGFAQLIGAPGYFDREIPPPQNYQVLERQYGVSAWVYLAVRRKMRDLASAPLRVMRQGPDNTETAVPRDHPLARLLRDINPWLTTPQLIRLTSMYLDLTGNAFWLLYRNRFGVVREIYPINPFAVRIFSTPTALVGFYELWHLGGPKRVRAWTPEHPGDLLHFALENPTSDYDAMFPSPWGVGPLEAAWTLVITDTDAVTWNRSLVKNDGRPTGLLTSEQDVEEEEAQEAAEAFRTAYGGPENAGRLLVLGKGLKYQRLALDARQLDYVDSREALREEILAAFGVNSAILGLAQGDIGRRAEMHRDYWEGTIVNTSESDLMPPINEFLAAEFGEGLVVRQDFSRVRALQENEDTRSQFVRRYWGMGVPLKVLNQRYQLGFPENLPGDAVAYVEGGVLPAEAAAQLGPIDAARDRAETLAALTALGPGGADGDAAGAQARTQEAVTDFFDSLAQTLLAAQASDRDNGDR